MNSFAFKDMQFIYENAHERKVLLDCGDFFSNKSRIPLHSDVEDAPMIPKILLQLLEKHQEACRGSEEEIWAIYQTLLDVLVTAYHIRSASPKKVLELGCDNGIMSYHLATLLGMLHPESLLYSVSDTMGNESGNQWLDQVSQVEALPQLAFAAVDYDDTNLRDNHFDIVVINGSVSIDRPDQVIKEAQRVTKKGGLIICFAQRQPLLESAFQLLFSERDEYFFTYQGRILVTEKE